MPLVQSNTQNSLGLNYFNFYNITILSYLKDQSSDSSINYDSEPTKIGAKGNYMLNIFFKL